MSQALEDGVGIVDPNMALALVTHFPPFDNWKDIQGRRFPPFWSPSILHYKINLP
jgi:hypothetical protein